MAEDQGIIVEARQRQEPGLVDGVPCNGVDRTVERRNHMRQLTMARQEAERRHARPPSDAGLSRPARLVAAQERMQALRAELERIDAEHRTWLLVQGESVCDPPARHHKVRRPE